MTVDIAALRAARDAGQFLVDRIDNLEWMDDGYVDLMRDWNGHVEPALARFKAALADAASPLPNAPSDKQRCTECGWQGLVCWPDAGACPKCRADALVDVERVNAPSDAECLVAPLIALAEHGISPDIQEQLIHGNPQRGIRPGALLAAIRAAKPNG